MAFILLAIGLVLLVEGLAWLLAPSLVEQMLASLRALPESIRRQIGAIAVVIGLILLWGAYQLGVVFGA
ncbi:MAG: DUF2065 domain-containing protein [Pseudomonadota bacterium]